MLFFIFSPNGKNFCQFMAPDFPKPMFLAQTHLGLVGALAFYSPNNACVVGFLLLSVRSGLRVRGFAVPVPCGPGWWLGRWLEVGLSAVLCG